jgi:hypothetical protein
MTNVDEPQVSPVPPSRGSESIREGDVAPPILRVVEEPDRLPITDEALEELEQDDRLHELAALARRYAS